MAMIAMKASPQWSPSVQWFWLSGPAASSRTLGESMMAVPEPVRRGAGVVNC